MKCSWLSKALARSEQPSSETSDALAVVGVRPGSLAGAAVILNDRFATRCDPSVTRRNPPFSELTRLGLWRACAG